jgi:hypothetical protein
MNPFCSEVESLTRIVCDDPDGLESPAHVPRHP